MRIEAHWLREARRVPSPNFNERPDDEISALVLHSISLPPGRFGGDAIERLFTNSLDLSAHSYFANLEGLRVSAHLLIRRDGEPVQFVPFDKRAWHAGRSHWWDNGSVRSGLNDFSIGIELEGDEVSPYRERQYLTLSRCIRALARAYPGITARRITSHAHIAPLRKSDPGPAFDWAYLRQSLLRDR
ncbi:AmpD protein [Modicisalibacter ilicicola DSM 19980]|uniref:1,6-anhydro-N-acetylmuramyl-L-alanine amidase AmpD n=1 Tax=Modicisalibacter ilicicola DSM 19980 TaxID=1121942 RepID=A0A1M4UMY3_9GAMM|nr:1,6-anhydro-N-acetylmuramyl-L-alanine amidase AmpD [Halomonas ilicicola]SHE58121.1 AmpD protein [Halomonas ilicicola DSM 19980]